MRDRIKTYVGVLRDNTAIVASVALFFLWLGITFQVPDFAVDGTFEPGLVAPWIVVAFCYALGYLVAVLWYRKIASLFLRRRFLVLVCLVMAAGVTIDIASSWNTDFFGSVSRVAYVGSILMCLGTTLIVVMTASIVACLFLLPECLSRQRLWLPWALWEYGAKTLLAFLFRWR